jgi:simple sugar transport system substrate-binding protein
MLSLKNKFKYIFIFLFIFSNYNCSKNKNPDQHNEKTITISMITHGQATDPFWSVVQNGARDAAKDLGIELHYQSPQNFDMIAMSRIIDAVIATKPDGIVVSIPDIDALKGSIASASKKGIPIIVINAGSDIAKEIDILTYVGQSEFEAGLKAAEEILNHNVSNVLCINHEIGNISLDQREQGFKKILTENNVKVKTIPIDASDPSETMERVRAYLTTYPETDAILTLGPISAIPIMKLLKEIKSGATIKLATFDFTPEIIDGILNNEIIFALDQQQYLQGYLPVILMNLYITNKNTPAYKKLETGPSIIDAKNAREVLSLSKKGSR